MLTLHDLSTRLLEDTNALFMASQQAEAMERTLGKSPMQTAGADK